MRRIIAALLVAAISLSEILIPVAYAQSIPADATETIAFKTLTTDSITAPQTVLSENGRNINSLVPDLASNQSWLDEAGMTETAKVRKLAKKDYRPNEEIEVVIENGGNKEYKTELIDAIGSKIAVETEEVDTGTTKVITLEQPNAFKPGKYTLRISDTWGGVSEQDFSWGVLAVNPDKSIYAPNEVANLAFAVLDEGGKMVCDAWVELKITKPDGNLDTVSTENGKIKVNEGCTSYAYTLIPDYQASYQVREVGTYQLKLSSKTKNGSFSIADSFEVRQTVPFDVKRISATRIYPPNQYPVTMEITANQDFEGTISETVPASFKVAHPGVEIEAANAASGAAEPALPVLGPDNVPQAIPQGLLAYSTVNDIEEGSSVKAVLGASVPGLGMPFTGNFPVSQEFGESLVKDIHDHDLYDAFGMKGHDGMDFALPVGTPLNAVDDGTIILAGPGDYGTTIVIQHSWGRSYYGHLSSVGIKDGDAVKRGQTIGKSGNTGISTGPHLHFGIKPTMNDKENGYYGKVDPAYYLGMKQSASAVLGAATQVEPDAPVSTDVKILTWKVNVKKGDKIKLGYSYKAPRVSPQFYMLGPAVFTDTKAEVVFQEARKWQIAADALDYEFKRGNFYKSGCTATCSQSITGVGFQPKAIILEWTLQTPSTLSVNNADMLMGRGFATSSSQERAVSVWSNDGVATSATGRLRSDTKVIVMQNDAGTVVAQADLVSLDADGFTISWTTNNTANYAIQYTAVGGGDVENAKAGSFTLTTGTGALAVTDPGFQPDFVMMMATGTEAVNTNTSHAKMSHGFATSSTEEGALSILAENGQGDADTCRQQRTNATLLFLTEDGAGTSCATQDAIADFTSFDATGFTLNKSDAPTSSITVFYLALEGGIYDVGSLTQPAASGNQSINTGFRPKGFGLMSVNAPSQTGINSSASASFGGGSEITASVTESNTIETSLTPGSPGTWTTHGTDGDSDDWTRQSGTGATQCGTSGPSEGTFCARSSATTGDNQTSYLDVDYTFSSPGTLKFDWKVSSEATFDYLLFCVNNDSCTRTTGYDQRIDGTGGTWAEVVYPVNAGTYSFRWMYAKDGGAIGGDDAGWVDNIRFITNNEGEGTVWGDDRDAETVNMNANMSNVLNKAFRSRVSPTGGGAGVTAAEADTQSLDANGFTLNWTVTDTNAKEILYWAVGTVELEQEDYRWFKNADSLTPGSALEDENDSTIIPHTKPDVRLRTNIGAVGDLAASSEQFKLQYVDATTCPTASSCPEEDWTDIESSGGAGDAWCNDTSGVTCDTNWTARRKITIDASAIGAGTLTDFPVLVKLSSAAANIDFNKTKAGGDDIRFVAEGAETVALNHEVDTWNEPAGEANVWVSVDVVGGNSTQYIWMYYGNTSGASPTDAHRQGVWDSSFELVQHFEEAASGSSCSGSVTDSTTNGNTGTCTNTPTYQAGQVGTSMGTVQASSEYIDNSTAAGDVATGEFTVSGWFYLTSSYATGDPNGQMSVVGMETSGSSNEFQLWMDDSDGTFNINKTSSGGADNNVVSNATSWNAGTWYYGSGTFSTTSGLRLYINGSVQSDSNANTTRGATQSTDLFIGRYMVGDNEYWDGRLDEIRLSSIARNANWVEAEYLTMTDAMNTFGSEEAQAVAGGAWTFNDNASVADDAALGTNRQLSGSTASGNQQTYQESNPTALNPTAIASGERREWDFSLTASGAERRETYYFRLVLADGTPLTSYDNYPTITYGVPNVKLMRGGKWTNYKQSQPFTF